MYRQILLATSLVVASTAQAQTLGRTYPRPAEGGSVATAAGSWFQADIRGDIVARPSGEAEFGAVRTADRSSAAFVLSLGVCSPEGAILFTRRGTTDLGVGRYRVSEGANGSDEVMALVMTGSSTRPTGVFRGQSGWLTVTAASDQVLAGRFQVDGVGFRAAEPDKEDVPLSVSGSFSATPASSSFQSCADGVQQ